MGHKALVVIRHIVLIACFWLPAASRKKLERWLRGREEYKQLGKADWVLVSWGKSGRTWLRVMLSRAYQLKGELDEDSFLEFDNFHKLNGGLPAVFFTHNNYLKDYTGTSDPLASFHGKRVVLLVRDPLDVAVSQFFQWRFRMRPRKKFINDYPVQDTEIWDFVRDETVGVPRIVTFLNAWARAIPEHGDILLVRYRDMRADPGQVLTKILEFTGTHCSDEQIAAAVEFARYDNMKKMEETKFFKGTGTRVKPGDKDNPQSFKVRKGKVGGYRDYFTDEQCAELEQMASALDPIFDYRESQT